MLSRLTPGKRVCHKEAELASMLLAPPRMSPLFPGRNFLRCWHGRASSNLEIVAINDSGGVKQASHLIKYDSICGTFAADVKIVDDTHISIDGKVIEIVSNRDPTQLPWKKLGVQLVIEGTGVFIDTPGATKHITAGAEKVIITAPAKGMPRTLNP